MKIAVQIEGHRNNQTIQVPVSLTGDGGLLTFDVPTVQRANACTFSVDLHELRQAITHLVPADPLIHVPHIDGPDKGTNES